MKTAWGQSRSRRSGKKREEKAAGKLRVLRKTLAGETSILQTALRRFSPSLKTPLTEKHSNVFWKRSSNSYRAGSQPEPEPLLRLNRPFPKSRLSGKK